MNEATKKTVVNASIPSAAFEYFEATKEDESRIEITEYYASLFPIESLGRARKVSLSKTEAEQLLVFLHSVFTGKAP